MTNNEIEFYQRIIKGLKEANLTYITYPQIAMSAIIKPENKGKEYYQAFRKISQKRVDFAVYDHQFNPVCIIELDDRTHNTEKDKERDQLLESAGIKTIRYQSKDKPEPQKIAEDVKNIVIV